MTNPAKEKHPARNSGFTKLPWFQASAGNTDRNKTGASSLAAILAPGRDAITSRRATAKMAAALIHRPTAMEEPSTFNVVKYTGG